MSISLTRNSYDDRITYSIRTAFYYYRKFGIQKVNSMWQVLVKLLEKWACCHEWKIHRRMSSYEHSNDKLPTKVEETLICQKCGKITRITL